MDDAMELGNYLPLSYRSPEEQTYVTFLWETFETNYTHGKYQFAFLAYHMLAMSFIYASLWQIRRAMPKQFSMGLIGYGNGVEKLIDNIESPFHFSSVNEKSILRLFKLLGCDNGKIGNYHKLVDDRNESAHSNGRFVINDQYALDLKVREVLRVAEDIQTHLVPVISSCYSDFLSQNGDPEEWNYGDAVSQIKEALVHEHYFSKEDIDVCLRFDISSLESNAQFPSIVELHEVLLQEYSVDL